MISGKLTPIPQNNITEAVLWHKKFFHISHNFLNKMRIVPIFDIWQNCTCVFFTYFLVKMVIMAKLTPILPITSQRLYFGIKSFFTSLTYLSIKCDLHRFLTYGKTALVSFPLTPWQKWLLWKNRLLLHKIT